MLRLSDKFSEVPESVTKKINRVWHITLATRSTVEAITTDLKHSQAKKKKQKNMEDFFKALPKKINNLNGCTSIESTYGRC